MNDVHSLSHTKWNCKYHVVFAPKYRRKVFYEEKRLDIGAILRELCRWKGVCWCQYKFPEKGKENSPPLGIINSRLFFYNPFNFSCRCFIL